MMSNPMRLKIGVTGYFDTFGAPRESEVDCKLEPATSGHDYPNKLPSNYRRKCEAEISAYDHGMLFATQLTPLETELMRNLTQLISDRVLAEIYGRAHYPAHVASHAADSTERTTTGTVG